MSHSAISVRRAKRLSIAPLPDTDPVGAARAAGLRYVNDAMPGIRRLRSGKGFRYLSPDGKAIRDAEERERIRALVIPPAWTQVWICPLANGHIQATGLDARGRKQYRYHARWRTARDETKYHRMLVFGQTLPAIRRRVEVDVALPGLPRPKVLATVVRLLEATHIRVGNEEYARTNRSYGLTTLRNRHVEVSGGTVRFEFRGKSGVRHAIDLKDRRLARIIKQCQDLPGQELFQYVDEDGARHAIDSADVNAYLHEVAGEEFTAKDFRTWAGTVAAAEALAALSPFASPTEAKRNIVHVVTEVARRLGNTRAVCRKCYVHPTVFEAYLEGALVLAAAVALEGLEPRESAVLAFLTGRGKAGG